MIYTIIIEIGKTMKKSLVFSIFFAIICITTVSSDPNNRNFNGEKLQHVRDWEYKGIALTGYWHTAFNNEYIYKEIDYFEKLGFNAIELVVTWYQDNMSSTHIYKSENKSIEDDDLIRVIRYIKSKGMKINLKPHVDPFPEIIPTVVSSDFEEIQLKCSFEEKTLLRDSYTKKDMTYELRPDISLEQKKKCWEILIGKGFSTWRARFNPTDKKKWFEEYFTFLSHFQTIALENSVDILTVGTELVSLAGPEYYDAWSNIIAKLQARHAKIDTDIKYAYAAHEHEIFGVTGFEIGDKWSNGSQITLLPIYDQKMDEQDRETTRKFWELFDYISMTVYYELGKEEASKIEENISENLVPTDKNGELTSLQNAWREKIEELEKWKNALDLPSKKVFFGELGYRSVDFGHYKPYLPDMPIFDTGSFTSSNGYNGRNQANCYIAMFHALDQITWLDGVFFWEEQIKDPPLYANIENSSYSIVGKPASSIIAEAFLDAEKIPPIPYYDKNAVRGYWFYYDDKIKSGTSRIIIDGIEVERDDQDNPKFRHVIDMKDGEMKQISQLSGKVTMRYRYGYLGMGVDFTDKLHSEILEKVRDAKGIRFKAQSDGKLYRCRVECSNVPDKEPNFHGKPFRVPKGKTFEVEILFNAAELVQESNWGVPVEFNKELIEKISFQTVGQPHRECFLQVWDLEIID